MTSTILLGFLLKLATDGGKGQTLQSLRTIKQRRGIMEQVL